jgi:preprotein translocase subunit SecA
VPDDVEEMIEEMAEGIVRSMDERATESDLKGSGERIFGLFARLNIAEGRGRHPAELETIIAGSIISEQGEGVRHPLGLLMASLQTIDTQWKDNLLAMDHLKEGIGLRGYGQKDPVREYQKEGYDMFMDMIARVKEETVKPAGDSP